MNLRSIHKAFVFAVLLVSMLMPAKMGSSQVVKKLTYTSTVDTSVINAQALPTSVATYPNGDYVACFPDIGKVVKYSKAGTKLLEFGGLGSSQGTFGHAWGIAVANNGSIYVSDYSQSTVQKFDASGIYQSTITTALKPRGLAVDVAGYLYVACEGANRVDKYDSSGNWITSIGTSGVAGSSLNAPIGVAVTADGGIVVASSTDHRIVRFHSDGTYIWNKSTVGDYIFGVTTTWSGNIIASTITGSVPSQPHVTRLEVLGPTGQPSESYESTDGNGLFDIPCGLASRPDGSIVVADTWAKRIISLTRSSGKLVIWGPDNSYGQLNPPNGGDYVEFATGSAHGVALKNNGTVVCWGRNSEGQCNVPQGLSNVVQVWAMRNSTLALKSDGTVIVWGTTEWGTAPGVPFENNLGLIRRLAGSFYEYLGIRADGKTSIWFGSDYAFLRNDGPVVQLAPGGWHNIALRADGTAFAWTFDPNYANAWGQSNVGTYTGIKQILGSHSSTIILFENGSVIGIGNNGDGRISGLGPLAGSTGISAGYQGQPVLGQNSSGQVLVQNPYPFASGQVPANASPTLQLHVSEMSGSLVPASDTSPPTSTFSSSSTNNWFTTDVTATISSTDNVGGTSVKEIHYSINQGTEQIVSSSTATFTLTDNGTHSISYFAVDNAGNTEIAKLATVKIDKIAPVTTLSRSAGLISLSATDVHSGVSKIKYQINGGAVTDYSAPFADTIHKVTYWAEDVAGNVEVSKTDFINAGVQSISVTQPQVTGGVGVIGTVTLDKPAGVGGTVITLTSSLPTIAVVDLTVTVPEGATTATFDIDANPVSVATSVSITASIYETSQSALVNVLAPMPSSVTWSVSPVPGGTSTVGNLSISGPAPAGGATVSLASSSLSALVGSSVTIPAGAMTTTFTVSTNVVGNDTSAVISATVYGAKLKSTLSILGPKVASVTLAATSVASLGTTTGTVTLSTNAPVGGKVVNLSSSNAAVASVPVSVTVAAGARTATFTVTAATVAANTNATITASTNGSTGTATVTVTPPAAAISTITTNVTAATGGVAVTGTVTLSGAAPAGGAVIALASTPTTAGTVPASVTVAAGATSATFTITTRAVTAATTLTVTGTYLGVARAASITVNPVRVVSTLTLNPTSVRGGTNSTGTVTLSGVATEAVVVTLTSGTTTVARVPASVTVPAGSTTATFTITTLTQTATRTSVITARTGTTSRTATLSVTR